MKYIICNKETAAAKGVVINEAHPTNGSDVCLCSTDIIMCSGLEGSFEDRVTAIGGTVYNSSKDIHEIIKNW